MSARHSIVRIFRRPTPAEKAATELAEAELLRMDHQTAQELSAAMTTCLDVRITRLKGFLRSHGEQQ